MAAGLNVSLGLYQYGPFLVQLQDCTFVRDTFSNISQNYCPGLERYSKWVYIGLVLVSTAVMLSLIGLIDSFFVFANLMVASIYLCSCSVDVQFVTE